MSPNEDIRKVTEIMKHHPICMLTTQGAEGNLFSRPMTVAKVEDDGELWFFSSAGTAPVTEIGAESPINLSFTAKDE